ncbi:hypothetical protein [Sphingomonas sp. IC081]|uniref:hypothetical protein n=1 Tax=Sphingomonas sp. IC081 TaxID=304378 RepID=UPI001157BC5D|nr:hypothetical protein [Sphingomonas sp. IC081]QDK35287.1 hypothetical protein DM450_21270 [Sphingomonas sp. IC081]
MSTTLIALALFGCSDDGSACQRLAVPVQTFPTRAACAARLEEALGSDVALGADAPTVQAQCLTTRQLAALGSRSIDLSKINSLR